MPRFFFVPKNVFWLLFSFNGRTNRSQFWISLLLYIILLICLFAIWVGLSYLFQADTSEDDLGIEGISFIVGLLVMYYGVGSTIFVKRFHDLGGPGWMVIPLIYVPDAVVRASERTYAGTSLEMPLLVVGCIVGICGFGLCGFRSGEPDPNEYGVSGDPEGALVTQ